MPVPINTEIVTTFTPSKTLRYHSPQVEISSIDFDDTGYYCITAAVEDESIQLYDVKQGKHVKTIYSKKYGCDLARFTHRSMNCIYASRKEDDTIRYLSLHDNQYIRYFRGHKGMVNALEVSPIDDMFLSAGLDDTVRLWDLRSNSAQGILNIPSPSLAAFDPAAVVFAVGSQDLQKISLYSMAAYDKEPFLTFDAHTPPGVKWTKLEFANSGQVILLSTDGKAHYLFDAYYGGKIAQVVGHIPLAPRRQSLISNVSFTVDGRFIFGGSADNKVCIWDTKNISTQLKEGGKLYPMTSLDCTQGSAAITAFSPKTMLFASANTELTFWLPDRPEK